MTLSPEPVIELTGSDAASVKRLREFLAGHPGRGTAVINYVGRPGARIVVVAEDGAFADAVATGVVAATEICRQAGLAVADGWDRELSAKIAPSTADRRRMAGTGR
ncbi:MAG: hypothetical protein ABJD68_16420 [Nakamurella sp.]